MAYPKTVTSIPCQNKYRTILQSSAPHTSIASHAPFASYAPLAPPSVSPICAAAPLFNIDRAVILREAVGSGLDATAVLGFAASRLVNDRVRVRGGDEHVAVGFNAGAVLGVTTPMVVDGGVRARSGIPPPDPPSGLVDGPLPSLPNHQ